MHSVPAHTYTRIYVCMYYVGISDIIIIIRCRPRLKHPKYVPNNYNNNDAKYHYEELTIASLTGSLTWFYWPFCNKHKLRTPDSLTTDQSVLNTSWVPLIYWPLISLYWIQIENLWFTDHWPVCTVHKLRTSDTLTTCLTSMYWTQVENPWCAGQYRNWIAPQTFRLRSLLWK